MVSYLQINIYRGVKTLDLKQRYIKVRKELFDRYYSHLNEMQRKAVYAVNGPLLVLAGAGSGKTTVLVQRIAHIIKYGAAMDTESIPESMLLEPYIAALESLAEDKDADRQKLESALDTFAVMPASPHEILSITFTNKAAGEMKERLEKQLGEKALQIWAGTFHSICARLLRMHIDRLGRENSFTIYDTDDQKRLMTTCIKELGLNDKTFAPRSVLSEISKSKEKLMDDKAYRAAVGTTDMRRLSIAKLYSLYEQKKLAANALDFDDMIMLTVKILRENADILEKYQRRFKYVLVDEYQDTNHAQFILTSLLCAGYNNIMAVGDDDQSIYKFRGATIENILGFDRVFKNARVIKLEQNYRSTDKILDAANAVIKNNAGRKGKTLWTSTKGGEKIVVKKCETQTSEAQYIIDRIGELVKNDGYAFSDFAVLYRTNAQSSTLETVFAKSGIPYRILGGMRFYDRKEIKDIIAYLCVMCNPNDNVRLKRIINVPKRGIGDATVEEIARIAADTGENMLSVCRDCYKYPSLSRSVPRLEKFASMIDGLTESAAKADLGVLCEKVFQVTGYSDMLSELDEAEGKDRIENVKQLVSNAVSYEQSADEPSLSGFLEEVALVSDIDNYDENAAAVVMMTIHSAKGLEFPVVFLPGVEENIFPGTQAIMDEDELEEERRLAYVAITRAKKRLFILHCNSRMTYGKTEFNRRSRFIDEIPESCCEYEDAWLDRMQSGRNDFMSEFSRANAAAARSQNTPFSGSGSGYSSGNYTPGYKRTFTAPPKPETKTSAAVFKAGDTVTHPIFGDGMVLSAKSIGGDMLYEVAFDKAGTKKIMGNFAKMSKKS